MKRVFAAVLPRSDRSGCRSACIAASLRSATCMMAGAEAELIPAHQYGGAVLIEHAAALVAAVAWIDRIFRHDPDRPWPGDTAGRIDLLFGWRGCRVGHRRRARRESP